MSAISRTLFLDANVLGKPITRTLLLAAAQRLGLQATWSQTAEDEANRHLRPRALTVTEVRSRFLEGQALSPTGPDPGQFADTDPDDRQILADAHAAGAGFLVTEDVDDFGLAALRTTRASAINPDLFMAIRFDPDTYLHTLAVVVSGMRHPPRTVAKMHSLIARQHPLLHACHSCLFPDQTPATTGHNPPTVLFRGQRCVRCGRVVASAESLVGGLGRTCRRSLRPPPRCTRIG